MDKEKKLEQLYASVSSMTNNPLVIPGSTHIVFGEGPADADIMIIGEAPGKEEDELGRPFVGRSGKLLTRALESIGLQRDKIYITNIVKTRPPNNRTPSLQEIEIGRSLLFKQIQIIQPKIICTLGASALEGLNPDVIQKPFRITKLRGKVFPYNVAKLLPTLHPAYILRNPAAAELFLRDLLTLKKAACI
ncbi:hypothetical protein A3F06_02165 [candidate division TM6 bacterium RIFCSPHIGHO2_12_FULL_36_22]|nr:MAG: hypothetical protein A3F06_02165 [candidate division TM6 bacterium RIFCSPHIGHO2_12_FULL_36_22]